jgi:hypothetical protein
MRSKIVAGRQAGRKAFWESGSRAKPNSKQRMAYSSKTTRFFAVCKGAKVVKHVSAALNMSFKRNIFLIFFNSKKKKKKSPDTKDLGVCSRPSFHFPTQILAFGSNLDKMSTSYKSIETNRKVMFHELCDAQISAELTFEVFCSIVDLRVQG